MKNTSKLKSIIALNWNSVCLQLKFGGRVETVFSIINKKYRKTSNSQKVMETQTIAEN